MKTLKEISKTGIPDTKWCSEEDVKKMFDDYNEKLKDEMDKDTDTYYDLPTGQVPTHWEQTKRLKKIIDKLSKEVMGE